MFVLLLWEDHFAFPFCSFGIECIDFADIKSERRIILRLDAFEFEMTTLRCINVPLFLTLFGNSFDNIFNATEFISALMCMHVFSFYLNLNRFKKRHFDVQKTDAYFLYPPLKETTFFPGYVIESIVQIASFLNRLI